jgi:hypothetical protein
LAGFLLAFGIGTGGFMLGFAVGKESNPLWLAATIIAFINSGDALLGAITEPLVGKTLDINWHGLMQGGARVFDVAAYHIAFAILIIYLILAVVALKFIQVPASKNIS